MHRCWTSEPSPDIIYLVDHDKSLPEVAAELERALDLLLTYLSEAIVEAHAADQDSGYAPGSDTATTNANVRRYVRQKMAAHLTLNPVAPMSPLHLPLGPYVLKVLHADQGGLPRPRTEAREAFYRQNDHAQMALNVSLPDSLADIDPAPEQIEEGALALVWDASYEGELILADLYRMSLTDWPGEVLHLLAETVEIAEEDLRIATPESETGDQGQAATGTDDGTTGDVHRDEDGDSDESDEDKDQR